MISEASHVRRSAETDAKIFSASGEVKEMREFEGPSLGHILVEIEEKLGETPKMNNEQSLAFVDHLSNVMIALNPRFPENVMENVLESFKRLEGLGVDRDFIQGAQMVAARMIVTDLHDRIRMIVPARR